MRLVGFTIEIYYDAWPYECQIQINNSLCVFFLYYYLFVTDLLVYYTIICCYRNCFVI